MADDEWQPVAPQQDEWRPVGGDNFADRFDAVSQPQPAAREGGLLQTVPKAIDLMSTPEGRGQLWQGVKKLPGDMLRGILDQFETPGKAVAEGVSSDEEIGFGFNTAAMLAGGGTKIPRVVAEGAAPVMQAFDEAVVHPAATRLDAYARTGDPNGVRLEPPLLDVKPEPVKPVVGPDGVPRITIPRSVAAQTGTPEIDSVLNSPVTKAVIDDPVVDRSRDVPYMAGGSTPLEDPTVYIDKHVPREQTIGGVTFDPADPWIVHENVEQHTMEILTRNGMGAEEAYRVAHFEFAEPAEQAWYRAHGIDQVAAEKEQMSWLPRIQHENPADPPPNLYKAPYPHEHVAGAEREAVTENPPTPDEIARAMDIIRNAPELQPKSAAPMLQQARDLGVIGPDKPNLNDLSPKEAGKAAMAARRAPDDKITGELPEQPNAWRQRFEQTLDKMETPEDARALIRNSLDRNNDFEAARRGDLSLGQVDQLAEVTGLDPEAIDIRKTSAKIKTNEEIRNTIEAFRTVTDKIKDIAQQITAKAGRDDEAEIAEMSRLEMQRDVLIDASIEPMVALRAEFGRAGNVLQEYMKVQRDAKRLGTNEDVGGKFIKDTLGRTPGDIRDRARMIDATPPGDVPKVLEKMRGEKIGPIYWTWVQGLISGWLTHTKYVAANELYADVERGVTTPIAAMIGKAKQLAGAGDDIDRVFFGESAAGVWGQVSSVPGALWATAKAVKAGVRVPLEDEVALYKAAIDRGEKVPTPIRKVVEASEIPAERPIGGVLGRIIGAPGDAASGIHTFYKIRGRQAAMESLAYREAVKEGLSPTGADFWQRQRYHVANPTEEMRVKAVADAYKATFMQELTPGMKQLAGAVRKNKYLKWVFPFMHIPLNLMKAVQEHSPLAFIDSDMRDALMGGKGGAEQDKALARLTVGSSIMGALYHKYMMGQSTGDYPQDQKTRNQWKLEGKEPNSILSGDYWVSYDKFGPAGDLARLGANLGHAVEVWQKDGEAGDGIDQQLVDFAGALASAMSKMVLDEVGFQTLQRMFEAGTDLKKWAEFAGMEASSFIPFSSAVSQTASLTDPYMRKIHGMWDAIKYRIPGLRETLPAKQDIFGPVANPQYHSLLREREANTDPVRAEMATLQITPAPPRDVIGHAKLTPEQYERYQATAGPLTHAVLDAIIKTPGWPDRPPDQRCTLMMAQIQAARAKARGAMQMAYPELIHQGIANRSGQVTGEADAQ